MTATRHDRWGWSWLPPDPPGAYTLDMSLPVETLVLGWNRALARTEEPEVRTLRLADPPPPAISIAIPRPSVPVRSFVFREPSASNPPPSSEPAAGPVAGGGPQPARLPSHAVRPGGATRIRPPEDVIKLEDRLHYLLQPPLETLLAERSLEFPVRPFAHQMEGVAFLYPRQAAILADEMGLGKTMQAVTAIRLLLRCREVRSVLLVCPKPLVGNWQREFGLWAPEIPLLAIEGDQARRQWQWRLPEMPVKIANYELLHRDREALRTASPAGRSTSTWSCSTRPNGSRTAPAPPARRPGPSRAAAVGR